MEKFELFIKPSILHNTKRLVITTDYIEYNDKEDKNSVPIVFNKEDIESIRYGVKWIRGYEFTIGRIYCIDIKKPNQEILKIRLKSIYGIRKKKLREKYSNIINALFEYFFYDIIKTYLEKFNENGSFNLAGIIVRQDGVMLDPKIGLISWNDIGTKSYHTYYAVFSKKDSSKYKAFEYLNDWNTAILYSVSRQILKDKNLYSE